MSKLKFDLPVFFFNNSGIILNKTKPLISVFLSMLV